MDLHEIIRLIGNARIEDQAVQLDAMRNTTTLSISKTKLIIENLKQSIINEKEKEATNWALLGFILSGDFIAQARRMGVFRASKYDYKTNILKSIAEALLLITRHNSRLNSHRDYLISISNMYVLAESVRGIMESARMILAAQRERALKGMLITLDFIFMQRANRDTSDDSKDEEFFSIEDLAESFSLLLYQYYSQQGQPDRNPFVKADSVIDGTYMSLLMDGAHIRAFQEFEIMVDIMSFQCKENNKNYELVASNDLLEKSIRLGYITSEIQRYVPREFINGNAEQRERYSLAWMAQKLHEVTAGTGLIKHHSAPAERFVYAIPKYDKLTDYIKGNWLATEELLELRLASREFMIQIGELLDFKLFEDVTVFDIVKVQRFLNIIRLWIYEHQQSHIEHSLSVVLQSLIPHFADLAMEELFESIIGKTKAKQILQMLTWDSSRTDLTMDIQYQPLIRIGTGFWTPLNVLGNCNLIRNSFFVCKTRLNADGQKNPIGVMLKEGFLKFTKHSEIDVKYKFGSVQGDVDCIALIEDYLFVFECKNSLIPCNVHELRTSFDYIQSAANQLDKFLGLFSENINFKKHLATRLGLKDGVLDNVTVVTCIVTGNRIFSGYRVGRHAVRQAFELANVIEEGKLVINSSEYSLWKGNEFHVSDLIRYIEHDVLHVVFFGEMTDKIRRYTFRDMEVHYRTFQLNMVDLAERFASLETFRPLRQTEQTKAR